MDQKEILTMAGRSPDRQWKTVDWKNSGQLKTLENEQAVLLKLFSRRLTELEAYMTQNKTMTVESAYRVFFETYDNLEANKKAAKVTIETKVFRRFRQ